MTKKIIRNFKLHDEHNLEMRVEILLGELTTRKYVMIQYFTNGVGCDWAGYVERYVDDTDDDTTVGYDGNFHLEDFKRGVKYLELAHKVAQLPIDTILNKRKEINKLILDMRYPN